MKQREVHGQHLSGEDLVARVFPSGDGPEPVPLHLAVCVECQTRLSRLREAWLLDRGAAAGVTDALPNEFWEVQAASVMEKVQSEIASPARFPTMPLTSLRRTVFRRPFLAMGSLAAALVLMAGLSFLRIRGGGGEKVGGEVVTVPATTSAALTSTQVADRDDEELIRSIDVALSEDSTLGTLIPEGT